MTLCESTVFYLWGMACTYMTPSEKFYDWNWRWCGSRISLEMTYYLCGELYVTPHITHRKEGTFGSADPSMERSGSNVPSHGILWAFKRVMFFNLTASSGQRKPAIPVIGLQFWQWSVCSRESPSTFYIYKCSRVPSTGYSSFMATHISFSHHLQRHGFSVLSHVRPRLSIVENRLLKGLKALR